MSHLYSAFARLLFLGAFGLLVLAFVEAAINFGGYTIVRGLYTKGRLLELSAVLVVFVIALLLRQIRDELRERGPAR